jgi:hypothetical protein
MDKNVTRTLEQMKLEDWLVSFRPDYIEAVELLDALQRGLENRVDNDTGQDLHDDVIHEFKVLRGMLDMLDSGDIG